MEQLSAWLGAGVVTAGVSAALLAGAAVASADTESGSDSGGTSTSDSAKTTADKPDSTNPVKKRTPKKHAAETSTPSESGGDKPESQQPAADEPAADNPDTDEPAAAKPDTQPTDDDTDPADAPDAPVKKTHVKKKAAAAEATPDAEAPETPAAAGQESPAADPEPAASPVPAATTRAEPSTSLASARAFVAPAVAPTPPSLVGFVASVIGTVVVKVGSVALTALQAVEAIAAGPPVLPPGSTVTVRSSSITLDNGQRIGANWYYPEGDTPPERMILLQHGLLALGPMYSYTAANLAEQTGSIVVTPSITSNLFLGDDHWLGGLGMASNIADLFVGDRAALTQSALDAGFATRYGLTPEAAELPQKFALVGHSLGGHLVSAAAGFLAENGAAADLVGVISLDGVPFPGVMEDALDKLDAYETATGRYIPIREIGAPWNLFNSISTINEALTAARPDHFNGVVLSDGVHMDSMQGGNPLIQFAAYVVAGFPQPQNPPAVQQLSVQWLDEWFGPDPVTGGNPFIGDDLVPGSTFDIDTPAGTAEATVIGNPLLRRSLVVPFVASAPTAIPSAGALPTLLPV